MGLKNSLKNVIEKSIGVSIFKKVPFGIDQFADIRNSMQSYRIDTVVDVGSNTGQSALAMIDKLPDAIIHCVEPSYETYLNLSQNLREHEKVICHNVAIGDCNGELELFHGENDSSMCTLNKPADNRAIANIVAMKSFDSFCEENGIGHVSYLKIDTEGYDLNVLKGAERLLSEQKVDFVEVEAGMNPRNSYHVPLQDMKVFLEARGYLMFGMYDQVQEWIDKKPYLRRCDAVFISSTLSDRHSLL